MARPTFKIEAGEVKMYSDDGGYMGSLGTVNPNEEQLVRVIARAFELGRVDKARELRTNLGL